MFVLKQIEGSILLLFQFCGLICICSCWIATHQPARIPALRVAFFDCAPGFFCTAALAWSGQHYKAVLHCSRGCFPKGFSSQNHKGQAGIYFVHFHPVHFPPLLHIISRPGKGRKSSRLAMVAANRDMGFQSRA